MSYYNLRGDMLENEHDETMTRKYGDSYRCVKNVYPDVYKLPEDEICQMTSMMRYQGDTVEEAQDILKKYIKKNEPTWQQTYWGGATNAGQNAKMQNQQLSQPQMWGGVKDLSKNNSTAMSGNNNPMNTLQPLTDDTKPARDRLAKQLAPKRLYYPNDREIDNKLINRLSPTYALGDAAGLLFDRKKEMDRVNKIGADNYYHRLAMCELGQKTRNNAFYLPATSAGAALKEALDIGNKVILQGAPVKETLADSYKDMLNNAEGYWYGYDNPDKNCEEWLKDLDINTNTWKK